jgi:hypothetical protein
MKKLKMTKMGLNRETVRSLATEEMSRAMGRAGARICPEYSINGSGCSSINDKCHYVP